MQMYNSKRKNYGQENVNSSNSINDKPTSATMEKHDLETENEQLQM